MTLNSYHVDSAEDGRQACTLTATHPYSVILMDCQMPVMDGFTATATIRERERQTHAAHTPIIALTANAMGGDRERCLAAGMDDYLTKPFSHQALADTLARWCLPQDQRQPNASVASPNAQTEVGERDKSSPSAAPAQIDRDVWETITTFQKPGQPNVLHKIIGLYLTSSQAQITQLRQAREGRAYDAIQGLAHSLKSSSAALGAHRLATLAKQLEEACRTVHVEQAEGLITLIEIAHRDACVIFRNELKSSPKEAA